MSASQDVRVALIGYGLGGAAFHAPLIACTAGMRLTTIVTSNAERRSQAAREHPQARIVDSVQAVWDRAQDHDVVVVTTSNDAHVPLGVGRARSGPARRRRQAVRTVTCGASAPGDRRGAAAEPAADRLSQPSLGQRGAHRQAPARGASVRRRAALRVAARALASASRKADGASAAHRSSQADCSTISARISSTRRCTCSARSRMCTRSSIAAGRGMEVDDDVFLALTHASGVRSHLTATSVSAQPLARMRVLGSRAAYLKVHGDVQEAALRSGARPGAGWGEEPREHWGLLGAAMLQCRCAASQARISSSTRESSLR